MDAFTRPVDVLHELGARTIVFTNAAGGLRDNLPPGSIVAANRIATWPYSRWVDQPAEFAPDRVLPGADAEGTYTWVHGPSYETAAEIDLLRSHGADVVGMSTAPEVQRAQALGIEAAALSCVTNVCGSGEALTHDHVVEVARTASARLVRLIRAALVALTLPKG